jgi:hypothetical protein
MNLGVLYVLCSLAMVRLSPSTVGLLQRLSVGLRPSSYAVLDPARPAIGAIAHANDGTYADTKVGSS